MSSNPLKHFHMSTFSESKQKEAIITQAKYIHTRLNHANAQYKCIQFAAWERIALYDENLKYLSENGFRVWEISETHRDGIVKSYSITWDGEDFYKHYNEYVKFIKSTGTILQSSYKEVTIKTWEMV